MANNLLNETFDKHLNLMREKLGLNEEISEEDLKTIQSFIDNNNYLKGNKVNINELIEAGEYILWVSEESLNHIKERHSNESKPGSTFDSSLNFRSVLQIVLNTKPNEVKNGMFKWLGIKVGNVGKMGVKLGDPAEVAKMQDYQMPDGKKEMVKVTKGERDAVDEISVITAGLGDLNGKQVLSLITMFPGGTKIDGKEIPMNRSDFAKNGFYFVVS